MEFTITNITRNALYPINHRLLQKRNQEEYASVDAHQQLREPNFSVRYDTSIDSYVITFYGVWSRINLPAGYFANLRDNSINLTTDERDEQFNVAVREKLQKVVDIVRSLLDDVNPMVGMNFSSITFWEVVNVMLSPGYNRPIDAVVDAFRLPPGASEIHSLLPHVGTVGKLDIVGGEQVVLLKSQSSVYYENRARLLANKSFKAIRELENKQVAWFLNGDVDPYDVVNQMTKNWVTDNRYIVYHADQSMRWPHVFIYPNAESYLIGAAHNVFRNWKMLQESQIDLKSTMKRVTYAYGGWYMQGKAIIFAIMATSPYPLDFSASMYGTFEAIDNAVEYILSNMAGVAQVVYWSKLRRVLTKPLVGDFMLNGQDDSAYRVVRWNGLSSIVKGVHVGDLEATNVTFTALPNPTELSDEIVVTDASAALKMDNEFSWVVPISTFFSTFGFTILTGDPPQSCAQFGDFNQYRESWSTFRAESKDAKISGSPVNQDTIEKAFGDGAIAKLALLKPCSPVTQILERIQEQPDKERVRWNASTPKLLALLNGLIDYQVLPVHVDGDPPLEIQFFGVITEPMQTLLRLLPDWYSVLNGVGAQAIHANLRTDIAAFLYNSSPHTIISDIDQSEEGDESEIASLIIKHLEVCISFAREVVVYKIQYTTPRVLNIVCNHFRRRTFTQALILKPCPSGVYSLETFLVLKVGQTGLMSAKFAEPWLEDREMLLAPKPESVGLYDVIPLNTTDAIMDALSREKHFHYCLRVSDQEQYTKALSAAMSVSEQFKVLPIGSRTQYELLITGSRWRKRSKLTERVNAISVGSVPQGGDRFPLSGPSRSTKTPVLTTQGASIQEAGMYNLAVKRAVKYAIETVDNFDPMDAHSLIDIGGRSCEGVTYTRTHWTYAIMDPHHLPSYIAYYNITHIKTTADWIDETPFDPYDVVVALFVISVDGANVQTQVNRINFLKRLSQKGKIVVFNYYANTRAEEIDKTKHRSITYSLDHTKGTFGSYEKLPFLMDNSNEVFDGTTLIRVGLNNVLSAQSYFGTAINAELANWIYDFNDFCPLRIIVT